MTIIDALLSVLGVIGAIFTAPATFVIYGMILMATAVFFLIGVFANGDSFFDGMKWWQVLLTWVVWLAVVVLSLSLLTWAASSGSPVTWVER